jgi:murein DD-endopeptidase MepM/ murein hydrolase activator NlpD
MLLAIAGCSGTASGPKMPEPGIYHEVQRGENLYRIAKAYGVSHSELARVNGIDDVNHVVVGRKLLIPGASRSLPVSVVTPERATTDAPAVAELRHGERRFIWPIWGGTVVSSFGPHGHGFHDGIDIGARPQTPIHAAADGAVIYSDSLPGYGNVVIIEHPDGYATVYAHNSANLVHTGDAVHQGQIVARVGTSRHTGVANLHFEIRKDNIARNPICFLPVQTARRGDEMATPRSTAPVGDTQ